MQLNQFRQIFRVGFDEKRLSRQKVELIYFSSSAKSRDHGNSLQKYFILFRKINSVIFLLNSVGECFFINRAWVNTEIPGKSALCLFILLYHAIKT